MGGVVLRQPVHHNRDIGGVTIRQPRSGASDKHIHLPGVSSGNMRE